MRRLTRLFGAVLLVCGFVYPLTAQDDPCMKRSVVVTVVDREGFPVRDVSADDFRGAFRGKPIHIESAVFDNRQRRVVIVLDVSGSMAARQIWEAARALAADVANYNRTKFSLALVVFASEVIDTVDFSHGNPAVVRRVSELQLEKEVAPKERRKTALFDALQSAVDLLSPARPGDVIYAITDGWDNTSRLKDSELEELLISRNVRLYCVAPAIEDGPFEMAGWRVIEKLVKSTGGAGVRLVPNLKQSQLFWFDEKDKERVLSFLGRFYDQMGSNYVLKVHLPFPPDKSRKWELHIADAHGKKRGDLTVLYPQKLLPCSAGP